MTPTRVLEVLVVISIWAVACTEPSAPTPRSELEGGCEAMRPHFPMSYSRSQDSQQTKDAIKLANAAFAKACP